MAVGWVARLMASEADDEGHEACANVSHQKHPPLLTHMV
jgi:hypothetical protein